jgi:hypothetical protein
VTAKHLPDYLDEMTMAIQPSQEMAPLKKGVQKIEKARPMGHALILGSIDSGYQIGGGERTNSGDLYLERFDRVSGIL